MAAVASVLYCSSQASPFAVHWHQFCMMTGLSSMHSLAPQPEMLPITAMRAQISLWGFHLLQTGLASDALCSQSGGGNTDTDTVL